MMVSKTVDITALPYRCPKCNEKADFSTLDGLRRHLAVDHSYRSPRGKAANGRQSPLTRCFEEQTEFLEVQLQKARLSGAKTPGATYTSVSSKPDHESQPKISWSKRQTDPGHYRYHMRNHSPGPANGLLQLPPERRRSDGRRGQEEILSVSDLDWPSLSPTHRSYRYQRVEGEGAEGHRELWDASDALSKASNHIDTLKATTDQVVHQQEGIIAHLKSELEAKDDKLFRIKKDLELLQGERHDLLRRVSMLSRENDQSAEAYATLKDQVEVKDKEIRKKSREVDDLSNYVNSASKQQSVAKQRLESYITDLLSRTHEAEAVLHLVGIDPKSPTCLASQQQTVGASQLPERSKVDCILPASLRIPTTQSGENKNNLGQQQVAQGVPETPQVNDHSNVSFMSQLATPTLTTLTVATPPSDTPTLTSPLTSPDQSLLGTSGYLSMSTPFISRTMGQFRDTSGKRRHSQTRRGIIPPPLLMTSSPSNIPVERLIRHEDTISPLSPGEVVFSPPQWFVSRPPGISMDTSSLVPESGGTDSPDGPASVTHTPKTLAEFCSGSEILPTDDQGILWDKTSPYCKPVRVPDGESDGVSEPSPVLHQLGTNNLSQVPHLQSQWQENTDSTFRREQRQLKEQLHNVKAQRRVLRQSAQASSFQDTWSEDVAESSTDTEMEEYLKDIGYRPHRELSLHQHVTGSKWGSQSFSQLDAILYHRDVLFNVFQYLDTFTLSQMALVCQEWRYVSRNPALWRCVRLVNAHLSSKYLRTMAGWCSQLQSLTLETIRVRPRRRTETVQQYQKNTKGSLEPGLEVLLKACGNNLLSLRVTDCGNILTDRCLWLASCYSRSLERVAYISDTDPASTEVIWAMGAGCRDLTTLIIPPMFPNMRPGRLNNRSVQMVAACWPDLRVLCIGGVEVSPKGLNVIAKICTRLQVLELDHMCEVTEDLAVSMCAHGLRGLEALDFTFTPVTPRALLHFVNASPSLRSVSIHLSISDYYKDTGNLEHQRAYQDTISKLRLVAKRPGLEDIIHIKADYR